MPGQAERALEAITKNPYNRSRRQSRLIQKRLATKDIKGKKLKQWQYEVAASARIWVLHRRPGKNRLGNLRLNQASQSHPVGPSSLGIIALLDTERTLRPQAGTEFALLWQISGGFGGVVGVGGWRNPRMAFDVG